MTFEEGTKQIAAGLFHRCESLESIAIPDTVETIMDSAFRECTGLKSISIPDSVAQINQNAFMNCTYLTKITLGNGVKTIGKNAFEGCVRLPEIVIPDSVTSIGDDCFSGDEFLESVTLSKSLKTIGVRAFCKCKNLSELTIYNKLKSVGNDLFYGCEKLKTITFAGTKETWDAISGISSANVPENCEIVFKPETVVPTVLSISVIVPSPAPELYIGDDFDPTGYKVKVTYDNNSTETIDLTYDMVSGYDKTKTGAQELTATYSGKTSTFVITVLDKGAPALNDDITLDGESYPSYEAAIKSIGTKNGEFTLTINAPITVSKFTFPKNAKLEIIATENGSITTTATSLAPSAPLVIECPITNSKGKAIVINAKSDLSVTGGSFGNITVKGKAELTNVLVNGNVKLTAKADKFGLATDTLTGVTATKGVSSNNNVVFVDCPSLGTINVKGTVNITGEATKAVALTASSKSGVSEVENLTVEKKVSIANKLFADGLTANGAVDVKGDANITDSTIAGKLSVKAYLSVNGDVYCGSAISCGQLSSDETANLTYQSLAITKNGIAENSADITVKVIDKNGDPVQFKPGDKKAVVVKSLKLPKGGTYNPVLILHEACGNGTLKFEKNKVILV